MNETKTLTQTHDEARLERLGFKKVATELKGLKEKKRKMMLAYEHFRVVRPENVTKFNEALKKKTLTGKAPYAATWQTLAFMPIEAYENAPPAEVLDALEKAQAMEVGGVKVFDAFEVAYIANVKDPILFGRVNGCPDRFFIGQWDDDVKITDLLKDHEG